MLFRRRCAPLDHFARLAAGTTGCSQDSWFRHGSAIAFNGGLGKLQNLVAATLGTVVDAEIETECTPAWLWRPGRVECAGTCATPTPARSAPRT